jgi:hypothetical protein
MTDKERIDQLEQEMESVLTVLEVLAQQISDIKEVIAAGKALAALNDSLSSR